MDRREAIEINQRLLSIYGRVIDLDLPQFRLIHTFGLTERRHGTWWFSEAGVALTTPVNEIRTVPKYDYLVNDAWALERLVPNLMKEEIEGTYSYEPIMIFDDVPCNWETIEGCIKRLLNRPKKIKKTQKDVDEYETKCREKAKIAARDMLANLTALDSALGAGEATSFAGMDARPSKQENKSE